GEVRVVLAVAGRAAAKVACSTRGTPAVWWAGATPAPGGVPFASRTTPPPPGGGIALRGVRRIPVMTKVHPKATPNWCPQVNPEESWTAHCVKEKIADDGKRHRCQKKVGHDDNV